MSSRQPAAPDGLSEPPVPAARLCNCDELPAVRLLGPYRPADGSRNEPTEANRQAGSAKSTLAINSHILRTVSGLAILTALLIVWGYVGRNIVGRLTRLSRTMLAISGGVRDVVVPTVGRDEIAAMGEAVEVFRTNAIALHRLLVERNETADKLEHTVAKRIAELTALVQVVENRLSRWRPRQLKEF